VDNLNNYLLLIDTSKAHAELEEVENLRNRVEKSVKKFVSKSDKELQKTFMKAVSVMQGTWHAVERMLGVFGFALPEMMETVISTLFASAKMLIPLFTAMEMTPATMVQGMFGMAQLSLALGASISAIQQKGENVATLNDMNNMVGSISSLIGAWSF